MTYSFVQIKLELILIGNSKS